MTATASYRTSPIKRNRRSKAEIDELKLRIWLLLEDEQPVTIRHLFYRLVSKGIIEKSEAEYKNVVCRLTAEMRLEGELPFEWLVDETRWMRKPATFSSPEAALENCRNTYRRAMWDAQPYYVEVWCEKNAIASILYEETHKYDVPLMAAVGFSSLSFLKSTARIIEAKKKTTRIFYFGDHDPSGLAISQTIEARMKQFAPDVEIHLERLTIRPEQIKEWNLPTRPTKMTDSRAKNFDGESVEVDAVPAAQLQQLCRDAIESLVDAKAWNTVRVAEESERESLSTFIEMYRSNGGSYVS